MSKLVRNTPFPRPVRTSQPQGPVSIDASFVYLPSYPVEVTKGAPLTIQNGATIVPSSEGLALRSNLSNGRVACLNAPLLKTSSPKALTLLLNIRNPSGWQTVMRIMPSGGNGYRIIGGSAGTSPELYIDNQGGYASSGLAGLPTRYVLALCLDFVALTCTFALNGKTSVVSIPGLAANANFPSTQDVYTLWDSSDSSSVLAAIVNTNRYSAPELAALTLNPWQLFDSQSRNLPFDLVRGPAQRRESSMMGTTGPILSESMPAIASLNARTAQPQDQVQIDWSNPVTKGVSLWSATQPNVLQGTVPFAAVGDYNFNAVIDKLGVARKWDRVAAAGIDFGVKQVYRGNAVTVLVVAAPASEALMKTAFSQRLAAGAYSQVDFIFNGTNDGLGTLAGSVELVTYDGGSRGVTAASQLDGKPHCWVASNSTNTGYIIKDGIEQALTQDMRIVDSIYTSSQKLTVGRLADDTGSSSYQHDDPLYLVAVWDRQLSKQEAISVSQNPWQIFKPIKRTAWVPA